jgi:hypothetical protein
MIFKTENSTYELDEPNKRIRRLEGANPPTPAFAPDREWKTYDELMPATGRLMIWWDGTRYTLTSPIVDWNDSSD